MNSRTKIWLIATLLYLGVSGIVLMKQILPALSPQASAQTGAPVYGEMFGPVSALGPALLIAWLAGLGVCVSGLRRARGQAADGKHSDLQRS